MLKLLCEVMSSERKALLIHTEIQCLSSGKFLLRGFSTLLGNVFFIYHPLNTSWLRMAHLADNFIRINNLSCQGKSVQYS